MALLGTHVGLLLMYFSCFFFLVFLPSISVNHNGSAPSICEYCTFIWGQMPERIPPSPPHPTSNIMWRWDRYALGQIYHEPRASADSWIKNSLRSFSNRNLDSQKSVSNICHISSPILHSPFIGGWLGNELWEYYLFVGFTVFYPVQIGAFNPSFKGRPTCGYEDYTVNVKNVSCIGWVEKMDSKVVSATTK